MPRKSKAERLSEVHALALQQFDDSYNTTREDRERALKARRFVNVRGAQWDWDEADDFRNKLRLEIDQVSGAILRIKNEYRRNRISARFLPADGSDSDDLAEACASRFRADTMDAPGREARDMAFDSAVEGGFGGLRLRTEVECGDEQRICLEAINDAESRLFFDVDAQRKDKSDAEHAFLITPWSRRAFVARYGDECASWPAGLAAQFKFEWFNADLVYVAEYFIKEKRTDTYRVFTGFNDEKREFLADEITDDDLEELAATGFIEGEPRKEKVDQVHKYVLNGAKVLDDSIIAGREIPLVPQYGQRTVINHVERFRGHVQKAMDAQIVYNLQVSKVAETAASSGIEKPVFTPEQIGPYGELWQNDHRDNNAYMLINSVRDVNGNPMPSGPVAFTKSPEVAPAVAALIQLTKQDIADQLGNPENAEQIDPGASGIALDLIQGRIDMMAYGYMDNAADAERRVAEVWQSMAADVYVEKGRKLKTLSEDMKRGTVEIGRDVMDENGAIKPEMDFSRAAFDIETEVGPTSASRRAAIVRTITDMMGYSTDPAQTAKLMNFAMMNMEGEGIQPLRDDARKQLIAMGVVKPTKEEEAEMEAAAKPQAPDPQAMLAGAMSKEAEAKAAKALADTSLAEARTKESEAKAAQTLASIPIQQQESALKTAQAIAGAVNGGQ